MTTSLVLSAAAAGKTKPTKRKIKTINEAKLCKNNNHVYF
jgi:hypothetical protein